jgi:glycerol-3-phosphate dehydrogenase (NAD(P)+)
MSDLHPTTNSGEAYNRIAVVGAGAWGTALALVASANVRQVLLWAREPDVVADIHRLRENRRFLPNVRLPENIEAVSDLNSAGTCGAALLVSPAQHVRSMAEALRAAVSPGAPIVLCAKGIEHGTGKLLTEVLSDVLPDATIAMLSGPSFARDVAQGLPTAVTIAGHRPEVMRLQASLSRPGFRPYASDDLKGVALGGAAKNVYAIACGMVEGAGFGESARAALVSRSFAELMRLGNAIGARSETLMGLAGLGDLVLTATSATSRNYSLGVALGRGSKIAEVLGAGHPLAEGATTAPALIKRASQHGIELPIAEAAAAVLQNRLDVREAARLLLSRPLKAE